MPRPSVSVDAVSRLRRLAASIDPERCESHEDRVMALADGFEELAQQNAQLRQALRQATHKGEEAEAGGTPEWIRRARERGQQPHDARPQTRSRFG